MADTHPEPFPEGTAAFSTAARTILPHAEGEGAALHLVGRRQARYEPIRLLGAGGMGEVELVLDRDIGRLVAVKRLLPGFDAATALRFVDEIRTLGQMEHPNIVPIYDVGLDDEGRYFFVMKYVDGDTLESVIHHLREGDPEYHLRYPIERRVAIFVDVLRALAAAHARGVVHRDVKPSNVMVDRRGDVFVMDWGIAKLIASGDRRAPARGGAHDVLATHEGALVGTPSYMSPEQACGRNDELDPRSDLYSAAALFHELLTLEHYLGDRASRADMLVAVVAEETSLRQIAERRSPRQPPPAELLRFVAKGLEKDPDERWKTAEEMIEALQSITEAWATVGLRLASARRKLRGIWLLVAARLQLALYAVLASVSRALSSPTQDAVPLPSPGD
jgi:serine/threonine-protein kinase